MDYRRLGSSGVLVSVIGLGGNTFGRYCDERQTAAIVHRALDLGINHIDTADTYSRGLSEEYIGKAIAGRRHEVVLATKTGYPLHEGPNGQGLSRRRIIASLEASLKRLGTDYVDLFYLHRPDPDTPLEESLRALDDLVRAGKVRYPAISNYAAWQVADIMGRCERRGYAPPVVSQSLYNVLERGIEQELIPACRFYGLGIIPYSPLAGGFLTGKYRPGEPVPPGVRGHDNPSWQQRWLTARNFRVLAVLEAFAAERGRSVGELALAWLVAQPVVSSVIAGATSPEQVESNVRAGEWRLSTEELEELEQRLAAASSEEV
uniref:Aldo/keto reductase n=1 Tax=Thermorudis peleae TaxID=1382356 RepID=A0A831WZT2_9BACT